MKARAVRRNHFTHTVEIRGGQHTITADEPKPTGGDDQGPSPQELLAASLASCSAVTLEMYASTGVSSSQGTRVLVMTCWASDPDWGSFRRMPPRRLCPNAAVFSNFGQSA